jgi:DNA polymerase-3 subunit epsilon
VVVATKSGRESLSSALTDLEREQDATNSRIPIAATRKSGIDIDDRPLLDSKQADTMFVVIDVETTGLSAEFDRITEFAWVECDGQRILGHGSFLINPECRLPPGIPELTGITQQMLDGQPRFASFAKEIVERTKGKILVAHNVRFDYGFLSSEFKRLGFDFRSPTLCTVQLARSFSAGLKSYSLKNLVASLGVSHPKAVRFHRAESDALLTTEIFMRFFKSAGLESPQSFYAKHRAPASIPSRFKIDVFRQIPNEAGVYSLYNSEGALLYVGKSVSVRQRLESHFSQDLRDSKERRLKTETAVIKVITTGSELLALLIESQKIKSDAPLLNRMGRSVRAAVGVFVRTDAKTGRKHLKIERLKKDNQAEPALRTFNSVSRAHGFVDQLTEEHGFCTGTLAGPCFAHQIGRCKGVCAGLESVDSYNERFLESACNSKAELQDGDWVAVERLAEKSKRAFVVFAQGRLRGAGWVRANFKRDEFFSQIQKGFKLDDTSDARKILTYWLSEKGEQFEVMSPQSWPLDFDIFFNDLSSLDAFEFTSHNLQSLPQSDYDKATEVMKQLNG